MPLSTEATPSPYSGPVDTGLRPKKRLREENKQIGALQARRGRKKHKNHPLGKMSTPNKAIPSSAFKEEATQERVTTEKMNIDQEPSEKIRLAVLEKKTEELQGYVNQIQDAVTIGMFQLRDLKKQIAGATAALTSADE